MAILPPFVKEMRLGHKTQQHKTKLRHKLAQKELKSSSSSSRKK